MYMSVSGYFITRSARRSLVRPGKARVSNDIASLPSRIGTSGEIWTQTLTKMFARERTFGVAFTFHRAKLHEAASKRGCHHLANLNGCPA